LTFDLRHVRPKSSMVDLNNVSKTLVQPLLSRVFVAEKGIMT